MMVMITADRLRIFRIMDIKEEAIKWKGKSDSARHVDSNVLLNLE
jgi:hypothetical protein